MYFSIFAIIFGISFRNRKAISHIIGTSNIKFLEALGPLKISIAIPAINSEKSVRLFDSVNSEESVGLFDLINFEES
ncbi:6020_t:CDS:2, partial [Racocetra persica]